MKSTVSERGQIVIPKKIRAELGLRAGQELEFEAKDGLLIGRKVTGFDPRIRNLKGMLKGFDVDKSLERSRGPKWDPKLDAHRR